MIEPSEGLTVLVGPNNCGKSAVVAALQILAHNDQSTHVVRHGERETSVTVATDEGHELTWRRRTSGSVSYVLNGSTYDRLKRQVPPEVSRALRLHKVTAGSEASSNEFDLHFGEQKAPVFLIDRPPTQAAQFFAASSDAAHLVAMQGLHKQKVRDARQERERARSELVVAEQELETLADVPGIAGRIDQISQIRSVTRLRPPAEGRTF